MKQNGEFFKCAIFLCIHDSTDTPQLRTNCKCEEQKFVVQGKNLLGGHPKDTVPRGCTVRGF